MKLSDPVLRAHRNIDIFSVCLDGNLPGNEPFYGEPTRLYLRVERYSQGDGEAIYKIDDELNPEVLETLGTSKEEVLEQAIDLIENKYYA